MKPNLLKSKDPVKVKVTTGHGKNRVITFEMRTIYKWDKIPGLSRLRVGGKEGPRIRPYKSRFAKGMGGSLATKKRTPGRIRTQKARG